MSTSSDESGGSSTTPASWGSRWILEDPNGVEFHASDSSEPLWRTPAITVTRIVADDGRLVWDRVDVNTLLLPQTAGLLLLQGLQVTNLFPPDGYFPALRFGGPFLYLAGNVVLSDPPPRVVGVRLGKIIRALEIPVGEIYGRLVESVLQDPGASGSK